MSIIGGPGEPLLLRRVKSTWRHRTAPRRGLPLITYLQQDHTVFAAGHPLLMLINVIQPYKQRVPR